MSAPPHILHVFPSFVPGGSQARTTALMVGLGPEFRHSVMSMDGQFDAREMLPEEFNLDTVAPPSNGGFFRTQLALRTAFESTAPDLVCTYNWGAIESVMAARSLGSLPVIHHEDGFGPDEAKRPKLRRSWLRRFALGKVESVIVPSHNLGRIARKKWKVSPWQLHIVANGIDLARFDAETNKAAAAQLRSELGIPQGAFVVGSIGHLRAEKNYPRLVEAFDQARSKSPDHDWRLLLVGDGDQRQAIEKVTAKLGLTGAVHLAGHLSNCAPAVRAMDVFCLSSDTEQMPISLVEAMAAKRPAVSMDVGDVARMLPDGSDDLVVPESEGADGLARRLIELAAAPERRIALGNSGAKKAALEYSLRAMLDTYRQLYCAAMRIQSPASE